MSECTAIAQSGSRCRNIAIDSSGLCHAHHPDRAEQRKRAASKGGKRAGRGRPRVELAEVKSRLRELAELVLSGEADRADAAVAGQLLGTYIRAVTAEIKVKEVEELEERITQLEAAEQREAGAWQG